MISESYVLIEPIAWYDVWSLYCKSVQTNDLMSLRLLCGCLRTWGLQALRTCQVKGGSNSIQSDWMKQNNVHVYIFDLLSFTFDLVCCHLIGVDMSPLSPSPIAWCDLRFPYRKSVQTNHLLSLRLLGGCIRPCFNVSWQKFANLRQSH